MEFFIRPFMFAAITLLSLGLWYGYKAYKQVGFKSSTHYIRPNLYTVGSIGCSMIALGLIFIYRW